jgi:hypothetical protein
MKRHIYIVITGMCLSAPVVFGQLVYSEKLTLLSGEISPDELLLKDWTPRSQLVLNETTVTHRHETVPHRHLDV